MVKHDLEVAARLEALRLKKDLSYAELGELAGKSPTAAFKWCTIGRIEEDNLLILCEKLNVSPAEIRYGLVDKSQLTYDMQKVVEKMSVMEPSEQHKVRKMVEVLADPNASNDVEEPNGDHGSGERRA